MPVDEHVVALALLLVPCVAASQDIVLDKAVDLAVDCVEMGLGYAVRG